MRKYFLIQMILLASSFILKGQAVLVADIYPGSDWSEPSELIVYNGELLFSATDISHGTELWKHDGTNTTIAADIKVGFSSSYPKNFCVYNNELYFQAAGTGGAGAELWKYDGTNAELVANLNTGSSGSDGSWPHSLIVFDNNLFFIANGGAGYTLWKYDGSQFTEYALPFVSNLFELSAFESILGQSHLYFAATGFTAQSQVGTELWRLEGSQAVLVSDINPGTGSSSPGNFADFNDELVFEAQALGGIWRYNGFSVSQISDVDLYPTDPAELNGTLYLSASDNINGAELWSYDGATVSLVEDIRPGANGSGPSYLTEWNNNLYMTATVDLATSTEIYKYDGTSVSLAAEINSNGSSVPKYLTVYNNELYFQADDGVNGRELWKLGNNITTVPNPVSQLEISIYPNPSEDGIFQVNRELITDYQVVDALGRVVIEEKNTILESINLFDHPSGIYTIRIMTDKGWQSQRLIKI